MLIARAGHLEIVAGRVTMTQKCKNTSDLGFQEKIKQDSGSIQLEASGYQRV
jgi:hypothetical protein